MLKRMLQISYQNKDKKINLFLGTIAIVTIFTLNLYILACLCFIMFAVVHTIKPFLDNLPVFGPTSPIK